MEKKNQIAKTVSIFFEQYKKYFIGLFIEKWNAVYPDSMISSNPKKLIGKMYNYIFPIQSIDISFTMEEWNTLKNGKNIDQILNEVFLRMGSAYLSFLNKNKLNFVYLVYFTSQIGDFLIKVKEKKLDRVVHIEEPIDLENDKEIIKHFQVLQRIDNDIDMLNLYKGIPLNYHGAILRVSDNFTTLKVHKYQALALEYERQTFIKFRAHQEIVKANVLTVDTLRQIVNLNRFTHVKNSAFNRSYVRVQPKEVIKGIIHYKNEKIIGWIDEISVKGIAFGIEKKGILKVDSEVDVYFKLMCETPQHQVMEIRCRGIVVNIATKDGTIRVGVQIYPDIVSEKFIAQYVYQRQIELVKEIHYYSL